MKDLVYYYDKVDFTKHELGEIQTGFNMSLVVDGTKDSMQVLVYNFDDTQVQPNTIIKHEATQTWWIVAHDKVERYMSEETPLYLHNLQLEGAIELLNARDLTDCGFYSKRYTVDSFLNRLFKLSTFELPISINYKNNISSNKVVDYIKTFENYTLLSAIREFLNGYNAEAKLAFIEDDNGTLISGVLNIVSKTGNYNSVIYNADDLFKDPKQTRTQDKNSFGTSVVSNAENVVSTQTKTYPSVGGVRLSSNNGLEVKGENAVLRLPSKIFKVNYIDVLPTHVPYGVYYDGTMGIRGYFDVSSEASVLKAKQDLESILSSFGVSGVEVDINMLKNYKRRIYYCDNYEATYDNNNGRFISEYPITRINTDIHADSQFVLTVNELKQNIENPDSAIGYTRGDNYISGFQAFQSGDEDKNLEIIDFTDDELVIYNGTSYQPQQRSLIVFIGDVDSSGNAETQSWHIKNTSFSVNYIPMSDLKIKLDNEGETNDNHLYNQNGKLTDSNALSKLLLSYTKEIQSDTLTKFGAFYVKYENGVIYSNIPNVGDIVKNNNKYYVINNLSLDFYPNEDIREDVINYYITVEATMSEKVATKSMLTNPNTNIRDYGIPQNNNVKRVQLYRDFYELSYTPIATSESPYLDLDRVLNLGNERNDLQEHIALIKTTFEHNVNGNADYYYQLETTTYLLKKSLIEVVDFKDNNIIGYGYQNLWSGFDISKILLGADSMVDLYSIPISYVDEIGELKALNVRLATIEQIKDSYDDYLDGIGYTTTVSIYNASVFIPQEIFSGAQYVMELNEQEYYKDALEVPVFEYMCQIDDSDDIIVGENILDRGNYDIAYLYNYALADSSLINDNNFLSVNGISQLITVNNNNQAYLVNAISIDESHDGYYLIKLYASQSYDLDSGTSSFGNEIDLSQLDLTNTSLVIARTTITENDLYNNVVGELGIPFVQASLPTANRTYRNKIIVLDDGTYALCEPEEYTFALSVSGSVSVSFTITRDNLVFYNRTIANGESVSLPVLQDDEYSWTAYATTGHYIDDGISNESGTIDDGNYTHNIVALAFRTITINFGKGVQYVSVKLNNETTSYCNPNPSVGGDITTINSRKQGIAYEIETHAISVGWETTDSIVSGNTTSGSVVYNATARRQTRTITASIGGSGSGYIWFTYTDPDDGTELSQRLDNGDSITLKYGTSYEWRAIASSGSYLSGTESGGEDLTANTTISTSFALYRTLSITAGGNVSVSGTIYRNGTSIATFYNLSAGQPYTNSNLKDGDTYEINVSPRDYYYYIANASDELITGTISGDDSITTASAIKYHIFNITINSGINRVRLVLNGNTNNYTSSTSNIRIRQGITYSYYTDPSTGYTVSSGGSGSGTTNGTTTNISPTATRSNVTVRFDANVSSGVTIYLNYTHPDSGQTVSTSRALSNSYAAFQVPYGTQGYSWTATSTSSDNKVISGNTGSYGGTITSQRVETISVGYRRTSTYIYITVSSNYGTTNQFAYATLKSSPTYTYGFSLYTDTTTCYVPKTDTINSIVAKKRAGNGYTETITIHSQDRDNASATASVSKNFNPGYGANSTLSLSSDELDILFYLV